MEVPLQAQYGAPLEPLGFTLSPPAKPDADAASSPSLFSSQEGSLDSATTLNLSEESDESLVDSQPICFKENPFLVANRKGKGLPPGQQILSGPPVGYGKPGQLQPWLFSKARLLLPECALEPACCVTMQ